MDMKIIDNNIDGRRWTAVGLLLLLLTPAAWGQRYSFSFAPRGCTDTVLYIAQHDHKSLHIIDSARRDAKRESFIFAGQRKWPQGVYALVRQDRQTQLADFLVDDSRQFSLTGDEQLSAPSISCKGSKSNAQMFDYLAHLQQARDKQRELQKLQDNRGLDSLNEAMRNYEAQARREGSTSLFMRLVSLCENPDVPDSVADKPLYYRRHYWDAFFAQLDGRIVPPEVLNSPQLFNKMNYFFFGLLYHADSDTICSETDRLLSRLVRDTAMVRYVLQYIEPIYYRATRNVGWDAVWCHLVEQYYKKGRCPWAKESELYVMTQNYNRVSRSLIGKIGAELWMMDTTQIDSPEHWHSSHQQPTPYVVLWFWDPDCHHCQEQSAELTVLYDSLLAAPNQRLTVYAVGYDSDVPKWKKYVRDHNFHFVNVGGTQVNIDYQEAYNVHGAPTMIILGPRREIVMNKVLPIRNLLPFLDQYEEKQRGHH